MSILRRLLVRFGTYHAYAQPTAGWAGYVTVGGRAVAFVGTDGRRSYSW